MGGTVGDWGLVCRYISGIGQGYEWNIEQTGVARVCRGDPHWHIHWAGYVYILLDYFKRLLYLMASLCKVLAGVVT
jgi:hypothetical protein